MNLFIKIICWLGGGAAFISICFQFFLMYLLSDMCGNYPYASIESPDTNYKAVIFQRDCGATTGFSTQISILPVNKTLKNESGNIFTMDGHPEEVAPLLKWLDNSTLKVSINSKNKIYLSESSYGLINKIKIVYDYL